jgi:hypothetical protein
MPLYESGGNDELVFEPVGTHVNKVANDDPRCIAVQRSLFKISCYAGFTDCGLSTGSFHVRQLAIPS